MEIESFNSRFNKAPKIEVTTVESKSFEVKSSVDDNGIVHDSLVEKTRPEFLDVPFRDYSMQSYYSTGEVQRLTFVTPHSQSKFDVLDTVSSNLDDVSFKLDRMEAIQNAAAVASADNSSSEVKS